MPDGVDAAATLAVLLIGTLEEDIEGVGTVLADVEVSFVTLISEWVMLDDGTFGDPAVFVEVTGSAALTLDVDVVVSTTPSTLVTIDEAVEFEAEDGVSQVGAVSIDATGKPVPLDAESSVISFTSSVASDALFVVWI